MTVQPDEEEWRHAAACAGEKTDLFFPVGESDAALKQTEQAKAVCAVCPVRAECLRFALDTCQADGIWGGLTESERRQMKHRKRRKK
ncbi:WhiB family transcriptional regulator [Streptomyces sp. YIM S03343]